MIADQPLGVEKSMQRFDAIIVGGGIAGSTTAASLAGNGLNVLVCEAGLPNHRRLAGELMHPPAAQNLEDLGLLEHLEQAGAARIDGFELFRGADHPGLKLPYADIGEGRRSSIAIEHSTMTRTLLNAVAQRPGVTLWDKTRAIHADLNRGEPVVRMRRPDGQEQLVCAPLLVSAEGRNSKIRDQTSISCQKEEPFRMVGWKIPNGRLPHPGHGHLFLGGKTVTLAYPISSDEVRVMFEVELNDGVEIPDELLDVIPRPFRDDVEAAMATQPRQMAKVYEMSPQKASEGRLAVVGDAGGCVHPITASGIAFSTRDAVQLAHEIGTNFRVSDVPDALWRYEKARRAPMKTRVALGPVLAEAFSSDRPEMRLLRHGIFRYWERSPRGRAASMGLLTTQNSSMTTMAREYAAVCLHALSGVPGGCVSVQEILPGLVGLTRRTIGLLGQALR